ncbi:MAG: DUF4293 domain-containing protein [Prevotella sp.]|nr:DUF4293 domain-containing protein [Prevotella sp.]
MIQRIQTVYLFIAFVVLLVCALCDQTFMFLCGWTAALSVLTLADVFLYKNRTRQALFCLVLIVLAVIYYIALAVYNHSMNGTLQLTWPMVLPAVAIVFMFMARKRIIKDEKLVRSLDRIR